MDTKREHRTHAEGSPRGNPYDLTYSPSGRLIEKYRNNHSVTTSATVDMHYSYCDDYQPHAVRHIFDEENMTHCDLRWDPAGNLGQISVSLKDNVFDHGRFLFWTVDNRMHAAVDDKHYSYYTYDYTGERRLKLTGESNRLDVNADFMTTGTLLNTPTLYPSAYLVLTSKGYTKHYYAGADRVAASLGGGGLKAVGSNPEMQERANGLFWESHDRVNGRMLQETGQALPAWEYYGFIKDIPGRMNASVEFYLNDLYYNLKMLAEEQHDEKDVYFYHSDHLGSASWITDADGKPIQHLQYLPFGEPFVNQHLTDYQERYLFTGKERDEETGYGYFGARYMDHELLTSFISVDRYASKYPFISPYAYCAWNPIRITDPTGDSLRLDGTTEHRQEVLAYLHQYSELSFQCDEEGYLTLNTEFSDSKVKTHRDKYIEDIINEPDNVCTIKIMETDHEKMQPGNPTLFGGTSDLQRDDKGKIIRVEGVQYLNINRLGAICGNDDESKKYPGRIILHEFSEGIEGCLLARKFDRKLEMNSSDYNMAHAKANSIFWAEFGPGTNGKIKLKSEYLR